MTAPAAVLHHATLPHRGGAVRVARLLIAAQRAAGWDARLGFELDETDPEALGGHPDPEGAGAPLLGPLAPADLARAWDALPHGAALHLHTSHHWPELLSGLPGDAAQRRVLLTLHDATPLTGGCAYPLDCPHFPVCADPCPRNFAEARARQASILALLDRLRPTLVSPSAWLARLARSALPGHAVRVIPNGVPWPSAGGLTPRARARALLGLPPDAPVALFAAHGGAKAAYKAGPQWRTLWAALRQPLPRALGFAVGGDDMAQEHGLTLWPYVDRTKLALLMRAADALVYPTLADNHPLVLLEAASQELPVASFAVGGVTEIVAHGETGLLVRPGDGGALLAAAHALLADPGRARAMGRAARRHGEDRFRAGRMAAEYAALLESEGDARANPRESCPRL